jgi:TPR repeat protein
MRFARHLLAKALIIGALIGPGSSLAQIVDEPAVMAYRDGDYETAYRLWRAAAEKGVAIAEHNIGVMFQKGQFVAQDYAEAYRWHRRAADRGHAPAQHSLGVLYQEGWGVARDPVEAAQWFMRSAEQGYARAQNNLGVVYEAGQGVPRDLLRAHFWLTLAARNAAPGVEQFASAKNRDALARQLSPAELTESKRLAGIWRPRSGLPDGVAPAGDPPPVGSPKGVRKPGTGPAPGPARAEATAP